MFFSKLLQSEDTADWIKQTFSSFSSYPYLVDIIVLLLAFAIGAVLSLLLFFLLHRILLRFYRRHCEMSPELLQCIRKMIFSFVSCLPILSVAYNVWVDGVHEWIVILILKLMEGMLIFCLTLALTYGIRSFGLWYKQQKNSEQRPIDGLLTISILFVWAGAIIVFVSFMLNRSPIYLLSGLGAIAGILLLLCQQTLLSLVASVQVNADHLVEIGDWISMESNCVDGVVEEITLHTVKVRNWDMTLVCLPVCDLVNKPFVNYTAMEKKGGRRIKTSILIDQRSIRFLNKKEVGTLKGFDILKKYLDGKEEEITNYNSGRSQFNTRHLTNLGTFRIYAQYFLSHNPNIRTDLPLVVRELEPSSSGVPLEIYCFTKETSWIPYEKVQSDIMEHLLAVLPNFRLRVFQYCSDIQQKIGNQVDVVGGAFRFDQLISPDVNESSAGGFVASGQ